MATEKKSIHIDINKIAENNSSVDYNLVMTVEKLSNASRKFGHNPDSTYNMNSPLSSALFMSLCR